MAKDEKQDDAPDEGREHPGVPDSQWEAEHPSDETAEQEARELAARMPPVSGDEADQEAETDADPSDEAADAPAEG
jgi:hypothetical protein